MFVDIKWEIAIKKIIVTIKLSRLQVVRKIMLETQDVRKKVFKHEKAE